MPTHHAAVILYEGGQSVQSTFSFQNALPWMGFVEISGTEGTIVLPDPNTFEDESTLWRFGHDEPATLAAVGSTYGRGSGVLDLARSIRAGLPERASGAVAAYVRDIHLAVSESADTGRTVAVASRIQQPAPLPAEWSPASATL